MCYREYKVPTQYLLSTTGCFVLGMIKVQRKFRFNRVLRMLGTYHLLPSSLQHHMEVRDLVARFLCGPPVQRQCDEAQVNLTAPGENEYKPRPRFYFRYDEEFNRIMPYVPYAPGIMPFVYRQ